jgi:hypothetical protein
MDIGNDLALEQKFPTVSLLQFIGASLPEDNLISQSLLLRTLLPPPTTYLCEHGFSKQKLNI